MVNGAKIAIFSYSKKRIHLLERIEQDGGHVALLLNTARAHIA